MEAVLDQQLLHLPGETTVFDSQPLQTGLDTAELKAQ